METYATKNPAEVMAHHLYDSMHLATVDDEVKRHLMILMLSAPEKKTEGRFTETLKKLSGAWRDNGKTAEEEIAEIYAARTSGLTRKLENL